MPSSPSELQTPAKALIGAFPPLGLLPEANGFKMELASTPFVLPAAPTLGAESFP